MASKVWQRFEGKTRNYSVSNQMIQSVRLLCQEIDNELIRVNALAAQ